MDLTVQYIADDYNGRVVTLLVVRGLTKMLNAMYLMKITATVRLKRYIKALTTVTIKYQKKTHTEG